MVDQTIWLTSAAIVIGIILILGLSWSYYGRVSKRLDKGIYVLGGTTITKPSDGTRKNIDEISIERFRTILLFIFIILTIILIIISLYLGLFDELISVTSG